MPARPTEDDVTAIYRATIGTLYGFVSRHCDGDRALAEDVTQEAWLRAVREWPRTGLPESPLAWLTTVARRIILNHRRRVAPLPLDGIAGGDPVAPAAADPFDDAALQAAWLAEALRRLPPEEARLLEAFHLGRHRVAQLAAERGISERAVEGRLRRARERLRALLKSILPKAEGGLI